MNINELLENEELFEINMSPSGLLAASKSINAKAGMEFELCIPPFPGEDEVENKAVADSFSMAVGRRVNRSEYYHGGTRDGRSYVMEPDGSIGTDDYSDVGLEFVSPPLSLPEMLSDFDKIVAWARKTGAYTNESTGLHMNVSIEGMGTKEDRDGNTLDYIKLAVLLGDEYVLNQFGRMGNSYAVSAMSKIKTLIERKPEKVAQMLDMMRNQLEHMASLIIHSGSSKKYTSINTKQGYIEFRAPGGDWLSSKEMVNTARNTLLRCAVALDAANDSAKYRNEYLKKLYLLLAPQGGGDSVKVFLDYQTGKISKEQLIELLKSKHQE